MRGIWLEDERLSFRTDLPQPEPTPGEAIVRVRRAGICQTDLELAQGYYPFRGIPGHEFVGEVTAAPSAPELEGLRVVGEINAVCHRCAYCRQGLPHHCCARTVLGIVGRDGAFAEYLSLPVENLHPVPETITDDSATFVEPLAAALQILEQVSVKPSDSVLVIGAGRLGLLISRVLSATGCRLEVLARHAGQIERLRRSGIQVVAAADLEDRSHHLVIEASGTPGGLQTACAVVRPRGTIAIKSTYAGQATLDFSRIVVDEITLLGSRCGPFSPALRWLEKQWIDPTDLIEGRYPLEQGLRALEAAGEKGALKFLLEF